MRTVRPQNKTSPARGPGRIQRRGSGSKLIAFECHSPPARAIRKVDTMASARLFDGLESAVRPRREKNRAQ
jgi:hypothetical protein